MMIKLHEFCFFIMLIKNNSLRKHVFTVAVCKDGETQTGLKWLDNSVTFYSYLTYFYTTKVRREKVLCGS